MTNARNTKARTGRNSHANIQSEPAHSFFFSYGWSAIRCLDCLLAAGLIFPYPKVGRSVALNFFSSDFYFYFRSLLVGIFFPPCFLAALWSISDRSEEEQPNLGSSEITHFIFFGGVPRSTSWVGWVLGLVCFSETAESIFLGFLACM